MNVFGDVDKFFASLSNYLNYNYNYILIVFLAVFLVAFLIVLVTTSYSYEAKLIKAIDMFNNYFMKNPQITTENLLEFNSKMKSKKVPKQLRKQWQQFVLYRDKHASDYMSFEICVSSPLKNSTYKRDVKILNFVSYILAMVSFITNLYFSTFESTSSVTSFAVILQHTLLCPILILILNLLTTIYFNIRHNAIVNDLNQNYQYFEVNMDKASTTIPEYVDYELLFDKYEIKHGIPVLYTYLQRRAEEEKRELEHARLKNVQHEKFNFDEAGVAKSLVLERAMQEAENYIAERNKFLQDTEQVNGEITQEEMNFREITKEYQREMQVSKETFDNFKAQLAEASSSIEANYLKKQQQQELDRQRNLERDYDTATERHNQMMKTLQEEIDAINDQLTQSRTSLERGMMSEFDTYSQKVYADAKRVINERNSEDYKKKETEIAELKNQVEQLTNLNKELINNAPKDKKKNGQPQDAAVEQSLLLQAEIAKADTNAEESAQYAEATDADYLDNSTRNANYPQANSAYENADYAVSQTDSYKTEQGDYGSYNLNYMQNAADDDVESSYNSNESLPQDMAEQNANVNVITNQVKFEPFVQEQEQLNLYNQENGVEIVARDKDAAQEAIGVNKLDEANQANLTNNSTIQEESKPKRGRGRPRKPKPAQEKPKRSVGRPRKPKTEEELNKPKRGRGRPKKTTIIIKQVETEPAEVEEQPKASLTKEKSKKSSTKQQEKKAKTPKGKSKKVTIVSVTGDANNDANIYDNLDDYLKEIDTQIAEENAKMQESQKKLRKNSRIKRARK